MRQSQQVVLVAVGSAVPDTGEWIVFVPAGTTVPKRLQRQIVSAAADAVLVVAAPAATRRRTIDLEREPAALGLNRAVLAFRRSRLLRYGLTIDSSLGLDVSGPLLAAEYLLREPGKVVLLRTADAHAVPDDWLAERRYTVVPHRYAAMLAEVQGGAPSWLQYLVIDQLAAYLCEDGQVFARTGGVPAEVTDRFHAGLEAVLEHVEDATILGYRGAGLTAQMRFALLYGAQRRTARTRPTSRRDPARGLTRFSYLYAGERPDELVTVDGLAVRVEHEKVRTIDVLGRRALVRERILWAPERAELRVEGEAIPHAITSSAPGRLLRYRRIARENSKIASRVAGDLVIRARARRPESRKRFRDAWLLMDRDTAADDNAEHLYRHLRDTDPAVNAWFVLARDSADWERLERDGFRLLAFGSAEHFVALLHCVHLVSSQADDYVVKPFLKHALGPGRWRFTFLQHGVIFHDLSRWLNRKHIDLFVTSTPEEHRSITADGTPYVQTTLEARLIGLARHDRLLQVAERAERNRLLVMPTWRRELLGAQEAGNRRKPRNDFWDSDYARAWRGLLESDRLRSLCERQGWQLTFLPHPNMSDYLTGSPLAAYVDVLRFDAVNVQEVLAGGAAYVTDYSSLAMEAGYLARPIVYFQFDRDAFYRGRMYQLGEWSYERQGFGPVAESVTEAVDALEQIARDGGPAAEYAARMQRAFPFRDGRCCERTVTAIRAICPETVPHA